MFGILILYMVALNFIAENIYTLCLKKWHWCSTL